MGIKAASVVIEVTIEAESLISANVIQSTLSQTFTNATAATALLTRAVPNIVVTSTPSLTVVYAAGEEEALEGGSSSMPSSRLIGIVVAVVVTVVAVLGMLVWRIVRRRATKKQPTFSMPTYPRGTGSSAQMQVAYQVPY